jgi:hypothetical protein
LTSRPTAPARPPPRPARAWYGRPPRNARRRPG